MNSRLTSASVMPADVIVPCYQPDAHGVGIVHLGIGAFHRAHQAVYVDDLLARHGGDWRIQGVSIRSTSVRDQLNPQDSRYTLVERSGAGDQLRQIGAIASVLVAPENPQAVINAIAQPSVAIISLTITEKGYCHDPATGTLNAAHPDIVHDFDHPSSPRSAVGILAAGLAVRYAAGTAAPTVLSCDNLPGNGVVLRRVLTQFAELLDPALANWIATEVAFPSTMVDRIVPAVTKNDIAELAARIGVTDCAMVKTEAFSQWVIEDRFASARPRFEDVGVQMVDDVRPFELAKLRTLNGSHSTLAYVGLLLGYEFVHEAIKDQCLGVLIDRLMRAEAGPTLPPADGLDVDNYATALIKRFANPALDHRLIQIAMDGSQKLPQRLLGTITDRLARDASADVALLGVAAWILHATGRYNQVDDPLAERLAAIAAEAADDAAQLVKAMLGIETIFGALDTNTRLVGDITRHVSGLRFEPRAHLAAMMS